MKFTSSHPLNQRGFTLVVTLSLMVLLSIIAISLLSLSTVSLRNASQTSAMAEARANARMALMIAIGELQKTTGQDTRVTAKADILNPAHPPVLGVWRSWEGTNHEQSGAFAGRPIKPNYASKQQPYTSDSPNNGRFVSWLSSGASSSREDINSVNDLADTASFEKSVKMLSTGTLGQSNGAELHLKPVDVLSEGKATGSHAWWISGENQKARITKPYSPESNDKAGWAALQNSHGVPDPETLGLDAITQDPSLADKVLSLKSSDLISPEASQAFHDLSTNSVGLLTNTATGGWRKDLSLLSESWDSQPSSDLPLFQINATTTTQVGKGTESNPNPNQYLVYPWASTAPNETLAPLVSWNQLFDWLNTHRSMSFNHSGIPIMNMQNSASLYAPKVHPIYKYDYFINHNKYRVTYLFARIHFMFSHRAVLNASSRYDLQLIITPYLTIWNPYNIALNLKANARHHFQYRGILPLALQYIINKGLPNEKVLPYRSLFFSTNADATMNNNYSSENPYIITYKQNGNFLSLDSAGNPQKNDIQKVTFDFDIKLDGNRTLQPGETLIFSPEEGKLLPYQDHYGVTISPTVQVSQGYNRNGLPMKLGVNHGTGLFKKINLESSGKVSEFATGLLPTDRVSVSAKFNASQVQAANEADKYVSFEPHLVPGEGASIVFKTRVEQAVINAMYPERTDITNYAMSEMLTEKPFASFFLGPRTAVLNSVSSKGVLQSSPFTNSSNFYKIARGLKHPVNGGFDFSVIQHPGGAYDLNMPASEDTSGFILSGNRSDNGLSRAIVAEIPTRPIISIAELTHINFRSDNPVPPFAFNVVANSDATPLIPSDQVFAGVSPDAYHQQYDDSYCANHLLFDDWFVSSITRRPVSSGASMDSQKTVYSQWITGNKKLDNRAYSPVAEDRVSGEDEELANKKYSEHVDHAVNIDSWKKIASRLEVEGMFNVNSTSAKAWQALLSHARGIKVPYFTTTGISLNDSEHPVSRLSIAADKQAQLSQGGISGGFEGASEFMGYRELNDSFIKDLSNEIVEQVRLRGPFLSLAEFVNRQLSGQGDDRALAGTIQAALNELTKEAADSNNPLKNLMSTNSKKITSDPLVGIVPSDYSFPKAAEGWSSYGYPGWTRQADIIRPIAPVLSARDDTFTIRAYGDSRTGTMIVAKAWCEAVVTRDRKYVDSADAATAQATAAANQLFGRKYKIISYRWLKEEEI